MLSTHFVSINVKKGTRGLSSSADCWGSSCFFPHFCGLYCRKLCKCLHLCKSHNVEGTTLGEKSVHDLLIRFYAMLFILFLWSPMHDSPLHVHLDWPCTIWPGDYLTDLFSRVTYVSIWAASEPWLVNSANDELLDSLDLGQWSAVPDIPEISHYISINCIAACMIYLCLFMWYGNPPFWVNYREWLYQYDWANDLGSVCPFLDRGM